MAQSFSMSESRSARTALWLVPGALLGAVALVRVPYGVLGGLALGFAAGWVLRQMQAAARPESGLKREWISDHKPAADGQLAPDQKVEEATEESFPASDPPAYTVSRAGKPHTG